jgi:mannose-1-phosphate guanylyltransferase
MVFAAGLGARLRPLTEILPKPVVPVANRPLAWFCLDYLNGCGVSEVVLNTHYLASRLREKLEPHIPDGMQASFIHETKLLGTGGGLKNAWKPREGESFVVMNGDTLFAPDLEAAIRLHRDLNAIATLVVREVPNPDSYGSITVDPSFHRVSGLLGIPEQDLDVHKKFMFAGLHIFHPRAWRDLPDSGCIVRNTYRSWVDRGEVIGAFVDNSPWTELGNTQRYLEANCAITSGEFIWKGIKTDSQCITSDSSCIGINTTLDNVVVGDNAEIGSGLSLKRVVVWEGARVERDLHNAIVTGTALGIIAVE